MRLAVIGSGVAGLSAAWLLSRGHEVVLYEADARVGGHANTVEVNEGGRSVPIDTGFIVYNTACYPNLIALFGHLAVPSAPTSMSFAVSLDSGRLEYSGTGLQGVFGQPSNLVRPGHWRMVRDILRFFREAGALQRADDAALSLGAWLAARGYSREFVDQHIVPMAAAIWSASARDILAFPAAAFSRFFANHGLLQARNRPQWRTVAGGSREYVRRLRADMAVAVRSDARIVRVIRDPLGVTIATARGDTARYDHVVIAAHADDALACLGDASAEERRLLSAFRYSKSRTILHRDARVMPRRRRLWSSWNSVAAGAGGEPVVSYWMNRLQPLASTRDYFVTLNPAADPADMLAEFAYTHPIFDAKAIMAQRELWSLQGRNRTWFCGSYFAYGFHEDALQSGLAVAEALGSVRRPWQVVGESDRLHLPDRRPLVEAAE